MNDAELVKALEAAIVGLQWMSESDFPFTVVYWQDEAPSLTLERSPLAIGAPTTRRSLKLTL